MKYGFGVEQWKIKLRKTGHPRILATYDTFCRAKEWLAYEPFVQKVFDSIRQKADQAFQQPVGTYELPDGMRLAIVTTRMAGIIENCAFVWKMTGQKRYAERAWREMEAAALFPDWQPDLFLSTAAMLNGMAVGYDFLYDYLTEVQRKTIRDAIAEKGLKPACRCYDGTAPYGHRPPFATDYVGWFNATGWTSCKTNWNGVCNGSLILAAVAVGDELPELSFFVLEQALKSLENLPVIFEPDGGFEESMGYWLYLNIYLSRYMATLNAAIGMDFGMFDTECFRRGILYAVYLQNGYFSFNFHDDPSDKKRDCFPMMYYADKYKLPFVAKMRIDDYNKGIIPDCQEEYCRVSDILWYRPAFQEAGTGALPLNACFHGVEQAIFRTGWGYEDVCCLLHGGSNDVCHGHIDCGHIMLDGYGERFLCDLGKDKITYEDLSVNPDNVYRIRAEGHNTVLVAPGREADQIRNAAGIIKLFQTGETTGRAVLDMAAVHKDCCKHDRSVSFNNLSGELVLEDELILKEPADIYWMFHTQKEIQIQKDGFIIEGIHKKLVVSAVCDAELNINDQDAAPLKSSPNPKGQADNSGYRKVVLHVSGVNRSKLSLNFRWE